MQIHKPFTYLISGGQLTTENFQTNKNKLLDHFAAAIGSNISMIQIREKNLPARQLFELTLETIKLSKNSETKILVNDRTDVALAAKADGVHLTTTSIKTTTIRQIFPTNFIIGVSTHSISEIKIAQNEGANFVVFSPIFFTPSKEKYEQPQGVDELKKAVESVKNFSIIALGGINNDNFREILKTGASGIAGISLFNDTEKLPQIIRQIQGFKV